MAVEGQRGARGVKEGQGQSKFLSLKHLPYKTKLLYILEKSIVKEMINLKNIMLFTAILVRRHKHIDECIPVLENKVIGKPNLKSKLL